MQSQRCPIELPAMAVTFSLCASQYSSQQLQGLWSPWNMASETEEWDF